MVDIAIQTLRSDKKTWTFHVAIAEGTVITDHELTMARSDFERLHRKDETEKAFVRRCVEFLLGKESKESILDMFTVMTIADYYPEFEREIA